MVTNRTSHKITALILILALGINLAGCAQSAPEQAESDGGPGVITPFNVANWLDIADNAARLEYIVVSVYPDTWDRGVEPIAHLETDPNQMQFITDMLEYVFFAPADEWGDNMTVDGRFFGDGRAERTREAREAAGMDAAFYRVISVPMPARVKISSRSAWGNSPETMWVFRTPPSSA